MQQYRWAWSRNVVAFGAQILRTGQSGHCNKSKDNEELGMKEQYCLYKWNPPTTNIYLKYSVW